jgi:hypothetical protein
MGTEFCLENLKRKDSLGGLVIDERILLNSVLKKYDVR